MGKKVAVVLAGCGVYDGSEIHESSAVLVHLSREGAQVRGTPGGSCPGSGSSPLPALQPLPLAEGSCPSLQLAGGISSSPLLPGKSRSAKGLGTAPRSPENSQLPALLHRLGALRAAQPSWETNRPQRLLRPFWLTLSLLCSGVSVSNTIGLGCVKLLFTNAQDQS